MRLDRTKFKSWLETKQPHEIVGENRDCHCCPLAHYYDAATGGHEVVISENGYGYRIDRGGGGKLLPWWAARFARAVDGEADGKITAGRALELLAESASAST